MDKKSGRTHDNKLHDHPTQPATDPAGNPDDPRAHEAGDSADAKPTTAGSVDDAPPAPSSPDEFDPSQLVLTQDYVNQAAVRKQLVSVPVRKPMKQWWIRVHPEWQLDTSVIEFQDEKSDTYLVVPELRQALEAEVTNKTLFTAINRAGHVFLFPVRLPGRDGRIDEWNRTAREGAELAKTKWVRISSNLAAGAYDIFVASVAIPDPIWPPDTTFADLLRIAFQDRFIKTMDHPVVQKLLGRS